MHSLWFHNMGESGVIWYTEQDGIMFKLSTVYSSRSLPWLQWTTKQVAVMLRIDCNSTALPIPLQPIYHYYYYYYYYYILTAWDGISQWI
jgi:hypothetical protein